jgi:predicted phage tail protein
VSGALTIRLHGALGAEYGREFRLHVPSPAAAIRLLEANFPGFLRRLAGGSWYLLRGPEGRRVEDCHGLVPDVLQAGAGSDVVHVVPEVDGAALGKGGVMLIVGAVLVGAAIVASGGLAAGTLPALYAAMQGTVWATVAQVGIGLALGGAVQMLTPATNSNPVTGNEKGRPVDAFGSPANVTAQGGCVPVVYGRRRVGSIVASAGIHTDATAGVGSVKDMRTLVNATIAQFGHT